MLVINIDEGLLCAVGVADALVAWKLGVFQQGL